MSKEKSKSGKEIVSDLKKEGFKEIDQKGSHVKLAGPNGQGRVTVPVHGKKDLPKGTMNNVQKQIEDARSKQRPKGEEGMKSAKKPVRGGAPKKSNRSTPATRTPENRPRKGR